MSLQGKILSDTAALDNDIVEASFTLTGNGGVPTVTAGNYTCYDLDTATGGVYIILRDGSEYTANELDATIDGYPVKGFHATTGSMLAVTASSDEADRYVLVGALPDPSSIITQSVEVDGVLIIAVGLDGTPEPPLVGEILTFTIHYKASGLRS